MKTLSYKKLPVVTSLPTPSAILEGVLVELSGTKKPYYCDGVSWTQVGLALSVGTTAPSSPSVGDMWVDTN